MAGHRNGRSGRVALWRDRYWQGVKKSSSDLERLGVAADHLRLVLSKCAEPDQRRAIVSAAVADLVGPAEELLSNYERRTR